MAVELNTGSDADIDAALKARVQTGDDRLMQQAERDKLSGVEPGATAGGAMTDAEVKIAYENNANTNAFTDAQRDTVNNLTATQVTDLDAIRTRVNELDAAVVLMGGWDASTGVFPGGGSAQAGHSYLVSTAGTVDSVDFAVGDRVVALVDDAPTGTYADNWLKLDYTDLISTAADLPIADIGELFAAGDVEAALQELATLLDNYGTAVTLDQTDIVLQGGQDVIIFDAGGDPNALRPSQPFTKTVIWFNHGATNPVNMGTFDIAIGGGFGVAPVKTETGAAYTLVLTDRGLNIDLDNAAANTVTIPDEATVAFSVGSCITITQLGAGATTIDVASGVSINGTVDGSVAINNQFSGVVLRKIGADAWIAQGDIT